MQDTDRAPHARGFTALLLGMALTIVDVPMFAIAMPGIGADLGLSTQDLALIAGCYPLVVAMLLLPAGRAGDWFGRRRMFLAGGLLFLFGAVLSAVASGPLSLGGARMLQGAGGAALAPQAMAMIPRLFLPAYQSRAFERFAMTASLASVCGPLVAGILLVLSPVWLGWRTIFLTEAFIVLLVMLMTTRQLAPDKTESATSSSFAEVISFATLILCLVAPLYVGPAFSWPVPTVVMLVAAFPCAALFARLSARAGQGSLVPFGLLRLPSLRWSLAFVFLAVSAPPGFFVILSLMLQSGLALSALQTGLVTAGFPAGVVIGSWISGRVSLQPLARVALGVGLLCASFVLMHFLLPQVTAGRLMPLRMGMIGAGLSMGLTVTSVMQLGMSGLPRDLTGSGAGTIQTMQQVSMAASIALSFAIYGTMLTTRPAVEAAAAMLWLQIASTGAATLLAGALLCFPIFRDRKVHT